MTRVPMIDLSTYAAPLQVITSVLLAGGREVGRYHGPLSWSLPGFGASARRDPRVSEVVQARPAISLSFFYPSATSIFFTLRVSLRDRLPFSSFLAILAHPAGQMPVHFYCQAVNISPVASRPGPFSATEIRTRPLLVQEHEMCSAIVSASYGCQRTNGNSTVPFGDGCRLMQVYRIPLSACR